MNAYLVYLPNLDAVEALIAAMRAERLVERPWMGLMTFAYLADDRHVVQVICADERQLRALLGDVDGAMILHLGTFKEAPCDVTAEA